MAHIGTEHRGERPTVGIGIVGQHAGGGIHRQHIAGHHAIAVGVGYRHRVDGNGTVTGADTAYAS